MNTEAFVYEAEQVIWDQIKSIRARSDALESMDPLPIDYMDDKYWV